MDIHLVDAQTLECGGRQYRCAIGKAGLIEAQEKQEGDNKTPCGVFSLRACYYRPDKLEPPETALPLVALRPDMGWCDDPVHARYNQLVRLPFEAGHEVLWREDDCYDLIVPMGYNDDPITQGKGSAIFMHIAKPDYSGTEGCVALAQADLIAILTDLNPESSIHIVP